MKVEKDIKKMVKKVLEHYGQIDILVNCAGQGYDAPLEFIDVDKYRQLFELDVVGPLIAMQATIPVMRKQGGGVIVNISSGTSLMYLPNMSPYSSVKGALNSLTLTAREELKKDNIVVSVVYPYMTLTSFEENTIKDRHSIQYEESGNGNLPPPDSAEDMAGRILEVIESGKPEQFAHDWMKDLR